jgi:hypothetical protein
VFSYKGGLDGESDELSLFSPENFSVLRFAAPELGILAFHARIAAANGERGAD